MQPGDAAGDAGASRSAMSRVKRNVRAVSYAEMSNSDDEEKQEDNDDYQEDDLEGQISELESSDGDEAKDKTVDTSVAAKLTELLPARSAPKQTKAAPKQTKAAVAAVSAVTAGTSAAAALSQQVWGLSVCLSVYLSVCLSVCLYVRMKSFATQGLSPGCLQCLYLSVSY